MRVQRNALLLVAAALTVALPCAAGAQERLGRKGVQNFYVSQAPISALPASEHRYVPDEVVIELASSVSAAQINALQRRFRLTPLESHAFQLTGRRMFRWRIPDGRSVTSVVRALAQNPFVAVAQPNYLFAPQAHAIAKK
jgi:Fervidolysin N-terminal prodomain